jgi:hypothetical protein
MIKIKKRIGLEQFINREYPSIRQGINKEGNVDEKGCPIPPFGVEVEDYINQNPKYGQIDKTFINFPVFFRQSIDDMGLYTDEEYEQSDNLINTQPSSYTRLTGLPVENYYTFNEFLSSGFTESQLERVRSYNQNNPYIIGLNLDDLPSQGFTGVISISDESIIYVIGGEIDNTGQYVSDTGVVYETFFNQTRLVQDPNTGEQKEIQLTTFKFFTKGYREFNIDLFANVKEEKYLGVVFPPQVDNDLVVDRGTVNVMEKHLKMSEIDSVEQLEKYGQGFFNVTNG